MSPWIGGGAKLSGLVSHCSGALQPDAVHQIPHAPELVVLYTFSRFLDFLRKEQRRRKFEEERRGEARASDRHSTPTTTTTTHTHSPLLPASTSALVPISLSCPERGRKRVDQACYPCARPSSCLSRPSWAVSVSPTGHPPSLNVAKHAIRLIPVKPELHIFMKSVDGTKDSC